MTIMVLPFPSPSATGHIQEQEPKTFSFNHPYGYSQNSHHAQTVSQSLGHVTPTEIQLNKHTDGHGYGYGYTYAPVQAPSPAHARVHAYAYAYAHPFVQQHQQQHSQLQPQGPMIKQEHLEPVTNETHVLKEDHINPVNGPTYAGNDQAKFTCYNSSSGISLIRKIVPSEAYIGQEISILGSNFHPGLAVAFGNVLAETTAWSNSVMTCVVPASPVKYTKVPVSLIEKSTGCIVSAIQRQQVFGYIDPEDRKVMEEALQSLAETDKPEELNIFVARFWDLVSNNGPSS